MTEEEQFKYNMLYDFVKYIATDYFELSHEKVRIQRDDYIRMAKEIIKELDDIDNESGD